MPSHAFFTTIAGLAVSLAGFASLIAWLRIDPTTWDPINLWRVKTIVRHALTIAFLALVLVPVNELTSTSATIRIGSGLLVAFEIGEMLRQRNRDPVLWPGRTWGIFMFTNAAFAVFQSVNVVLGSTAMLQLGYLILLASPAGIFYNFVHELGAPSAEGT